MSDRREFLRVTFGRKMDVKQLRAALVRAMRQAARDPLAGASPARLESILIQPDQTTVYLSGNDSGLDAVARAVRAGLPGGRVAKAQAADARRPPRALAPKRRKRSGPAASA